MYQKIAQTLCADVECVKFAGRNAHDREDLREQLYRHRSQTTEIIAGYESITGDDHSHNTFINVDDDTSLNSLLLLATVLSRTRGADCSAAVAACGVGL